jgi:putative spermidine/putrescine transport system substrate-binding protein/spermidine/putrescine transport system substrate-binding protein
MTDGPGLDLVLSRRALLANGGRAAVALSAAGGLAGLVAACGGDDDEEEGGAGAGGTPQAPALTAEEIAAATGTVRALVWQGYDDKAIFTGLEGVKIDPGYLTQNEDVLTKLRVGDRAQFDTTTIFQGYIDPLRELDAIEPIDERLLKNFSGMIPRFQEEEAMRRDGQLYSVPFLWGTMQVNYRSDQVDAPQTLDDLMDPSLKGKIGLNDDLYSSITQFARFAGAEDPNRLTQEELDATMELLREFKPQVASIQPGSELTGLLVRGEVAVSTPDWAPSIVQARAQGLEVESTMPALTFIDGWLMVRDGENTAASYKLIDAAISKQAQLTAADMLGLGVVNEAAADALPEDVRSAWPYDDIDSLLTDAPAYSGVPVESDEYATLQDWVKAWEQFKAS